MMRRVPFALTLFALTAWSLAARAEDGKLTVHVLPRDAEVLIDGDLKPPRAADVPFVLPPGSHRIEARLAGHAGVWRTVEIKPGEQTVLELRLVRGAGELSVFPHRADAVVELDGQQLGRGAITRSVAPGLHRVRVYTSDADVQEIEVIVSAGGAHRVQQSIDGLLATDSPSDKQAHKRPGSEPAERTGLYLHGYFALMSPLGSASGHTRADGVQGGIGGSLRVGYRFLEWAGVELNAHLGWMEVGGSSDASADTSYSFYTVRLGPGLRVLAPTRSTVRFVGTVSGGFVWDILSWDPNVPGTALVDTSGPDGFGQIDVGIELEFESVLTDIVFMNAITSTNGLAPDGASASAFDDAPLFVLGPAISLGYGVW